MQACAVLGISPAATSLRSWTAAGLKVLHEAFFLNYIFLLYSANGGRPGLCFLFQDDPAPDQKIFSMGTEALFLKIGKRLSQCQIEIAPSFGVIARIPHLIDVCIIKSTFIDPSPGWFHNPFPEKFTLMIAGNPFCPYWILFHPLSIDYESRELRSIQTLTETLLLSEETDSFKCSTFFHLPVPEYLFAWNIYTSRRKIPAVGSNRQNCLPEHKEPCPVWLASEERDMH